MTIIIQVNSTANEDSHTRQILGRTEISDGLPNKASFTSVEVFDIDGDGLDEIYLGGAGRGSVKTAGIHAFEYDKDRGDWRKFGSGLPDESSGQFYPEHGPAAYNPPPLWHTYLLNSLKYPPLQ